MVTTATVVERIESGLSAVSAEVLDLPNVAGEWDVLPDGNRTSIAVDWAHLMADYLPELDAYYRSGEMMPDQQRRYRELLEQLKGALPVIRRLDLYRPPVPLR
ncbi:MAG: hypothetical protein ACRDI2_25290 [Chloroflexota bacterium]